MYHKHYWDYFLNTSPIFSVIVGEDSKIKIYCILIDFRIAYYYIPCLATDFFYLNASVFLAAYLNHTPAPALKKKKTISTCSVIFALYALSKYLGNLNSLVGNILNEWWFEMLLAFFHPLEKLPQLFQC